MKLLGVRCDGAPLPLGLDHPTPQSIADAKHAMWEERAAVERAIGRPVSGDGRILKFPEAPCVFIRCAKCQFESQGKNEGLAIRGIARHILAKHDPRRPA